MTKGPQLDGMTIQYKQQYERHQSIHILQTQDDDDDNIWPALSEHRCLQFDKRIFGQNDEYCLLYTKVDIYRTTNVNIDL